MVGAKSKIGYELRELQVFMRWPWRSSPFIEKNENIIGFNWVDSVCLPCKTQNIVKSCFYWFSKIWCGWIYCPLEIWQSLPVELFFGIIPELFTELFWKCFKSSPGGINPYLCYLKMLQNCSKSSPFFRSRIKPLGMNCSNILKNCSESSFCGCYLYVDCGMLISPKARGINPNL